MRKMNKPIIWTTKQILKATEGVLIFGNTETNFSGISTDSRTIAAAEFFVAIKGDQFDGHNFVDDVVSKKVMGFLINTDHINKFKGTGLNNKGGICIAVKNTTHALGDMANFQRKRSKALIVAITGSNGKTSTKEMTASVFSKKFTTHATTGNLNNEIGLPLTLLKLNKSHKVAVVELGMNHAGEIRNLSRICNPDVAIITNISPAHIQYLGSLENITKAKMEIFEGIKNNGTLILNADDKRVLNIQKKVKNFKKIKNVLLYGKSKKTLIRASEIRTSGLETSFVLSAPGESISVVLKIPGEFMISNALAAAAAGYVNGLTMLEIKEGLESFKPVDGRMNIIKTKKGFTLINDTYNANPGSMEAAIKTLKSLKKKNRGFVVVGDMLELGEKSRELHEKIGCIIAEMKMNKLYAVGNFADDVLNGAINKGMDSKKTHAGSKEEITDLLKSHLSEKDWILIKGSRSMKMGNIVEKINDWGDI